MCMCAVWINEHVIPSLADDGDDDIKECEEIHKGRFYADDDEDIGPLGDSVTAPQLTWSQTGHVSLRQDIEDVDHQEGHHRGFWGSRPRNADWLDSLPRDNGLGRFVAWVALRCS